MGMHMGVWEEFENHHYLENQGKKWKQKKIFAEKSESY
jgi:hypothetical protein